MREGIIVLALRNSLLALRREYIPKSEKRRANGGKLALTLAEQADKLSL